LGDRDDDSGGECNPRDAADNGLDAGDLREKRSEEIRDTARYGDLEIDRV